MISIHWNWPFHLVVWGCKNSILTNCFVSISLSISVSLTEENWVVQVSFLSQPFSFLSSCGKFGIFKCSYNMYMQVIGCLQRVLRLPNSWKKTFLYQRTWTVISVPILLLRVPLIVFHSLQHYKSYLYQSADTQPFYKAFKLLHITTILWLLLLHSSYYYCSFNNYNTLSLHLLCRSMSFYLFQF